MSRLRGHLGLERLAFAEMKNVRKGMNDFLNQNFKLACNAL